MLKALFIYLMVHIKLKLIFIRIHPLVNFCFVFLIMGVALVKIRFHWFFAIIKTIVMRLTLQDIHSKPLTNIFGWGLLDVQAQLHLLTIIL